MNDFFYKKLEAYKLAKDFTIYVYSLLNKYPAYEQYAICDQLRRAAVSVPSNIAEGMGRVSDKEKAHFLEIAYGSLTETFCQLYIAHDLGYISDIEVTNETERINVIGKMLSGLCASFQHHLEESANS